jgi:GR25 family glycosyltransferase involved in LPS biosynthesis
MIFKDCSLFIIHMERCHEREEGIKQLERLFDKEITIIEAIDKEKFDDETKEFYRSLKNFRRMPALKETHLFGRVACFLSHMKALKHIIDNRLSNVIVFEDDAVVKNEDFLTREIDESRDIIYLGYFIFTGNKKPLVLQTHALYYKDWEAAKFIYDYAMSNQRKWRAIDVFLDNEILPKLKYALYDWVRQADFVSTIHPKKESEKKKVEKHLIRHEEFISGS